MSAQDKERAEARKRMDDGSQRAFEQKQRERALKMQKKQSGTNEPVPPPGPKMSPKMAPKTDAKMAPKPAGSVSPTPMSASSPTASASPATAPK